MSFADIREILNNVTVSSWDRLQADLSINYISEIAADRCELVHDYIFDTLDFLAWRSGAAGCAWLYENRDYQWLIVYDSDGCEHKALITGLSDRAILRRLCDLFEELE